MNLKKNYTINVVVHFQINWNPIDKTMGNVLQMPLVLGDLADFTIGIMSSRPLRLLFWLVNFTDVTVGFPLPFISKETLCRFRSTFCCLRVLRPIEQHTPRYTFLIVCRWTNRRQRHRLLFVSDEQINGQRNRLQTTVLQDVEYWLYPLKLKCCGYIV